MKNEFIILLLLKLLTSNIQSQLTNKERENLLKKNTKNIGKNSQTIFDPPKSFLHGDNFTYEASRIKKII